MGAAEALQTMTMQELEEQLPPMSQDRLRANLIYHALAFRQMPIADGGGQLADCGMRVFVGDGFAEFGLCVVEIVDEDVREKFGFDPCYVYKGPGNTVNGEPEAVGFSDLEGAVAQFRAEQTS